MYAMNLNSQYMYENPRQNEKLSKTQRKKIRNLTNYPLYFRILGWFTYNKIVYKVKRESACFWKKHIEKNYWRGFKNDCPNPSGFV